MFKFNISSFLEKFKDIKDPHEDKSHISKILLEVAGVNVVENNIQIKNKTIHIQASSLYKSRIFIKKEEILKVINENHPELEIKEIF
jgi:cystathionine beta-lyase family protein involved in aluminum resistance